VNKSADRRFPTLTSKRQHDLGLVRFSRQLYQETALLPYKLALFDFGLSASGWSEREEVIEDFLQRRLRVQIEALEKMKLRYSVDSGTPYSGVWWIARLKLCYLLDAPRV